MVKLKNMKNKNLNLKNACIIKCFKLTLVLMSILFSSACITNSNKNIKIVEKNQNPKDTITDWCIIMKNIECIISSDINEEAQYPVLNISLTYSGEKPCEIKWDENFGTVLWQGKFVLTASTAEKSENTSQMKYRTSNTYPPNKTVILHKMETINSNLDFTELPATYATNLFSNTGDVKFQLFIQLFTEDGEVMYPVSNELILEVE